MTTPRKSYTIDSSPTDELVFFDYPQGHRVSIIRPVIGDLFDISLIDESLRDGVFPSLCVKLIPDRTMEFYRKRFGTPAATEMFRKILADWRNPVAYTPGAIGVKRIEKNGKGFVFTEPDQDTFTQLTEERLEANKTLSLPLFESNLRVGIGTFENTYWAKRAVDMIGPHIVGQEITLGPAIPFVEVI